MLYRHTVAEKSKNVSLDSPCSLGRARRDADDLPTRCKHLLNTCTLIEYIYIRGWIRFATGVFTCPYGFQPSNYPRRLRDQLHRVQLEVVLALIL